MARKGITFDQVCNAAAAIKARGIEPTISAVRVELNNEGSFSTISQHLSKWREETADKVDIKSLPEDVENAAMTAITTIWNIAYKMATEEITAIKQEAKDEKKRLISELEEANAEVARLEERLQALTEEAEKAKNLAVTQEKKLTVISSELEVTKEHYTQLLNSIKQPSGKPALAADTKQAHPSKSKHEPENKQDASHAKL